MVDIEKMKKELVGLEVVENNIKSLTGFNKGDEAVNGFNQKVKVVDISRGKIVFEWLDAHKVDALGEDEFDALFKKVDNGTA